MLDRKRRCALCSAACLLGTISTSCCNRLKMKRKLISVIIYSLPFVKAVLKGGHL